MNGASIRRGAGMLCLPNRTVRCMVAGVALCVSLSNPLLGASSVHAQQPEPPAPRVDPPSRTRLPSLDEMLGLRPAAGADDASGAGGSGGIGDALIDPERAALDRKLSSEDMAEAFQQAVELMGETAERLNPGLDPGLVTQRLQEDIVRKLDAVIASAQNNQNSSSSSSSSSASASEREQQNQPSQQRNQQDQQQAQNQQQGEPQEGTAPGAQSGAGNTVTLNAAAWGALPARLREALLQGSGDQFSSLYQGLTEQYYRRLAEERKP